MGGTDWAGVLMRDRLDRSLGWDRLGRSLDIQIDWSWRGQQYKDLGWHRQDKELGSAATEPHLQAGAITGRHTGAEAVKHA